MSCQLAEAEATQTTNQPKYVPHTVQQNDAIQFIVFSLAVKVTFRKQYRNNEKYNTKRYLAFSGPH